MRRQPLSDPVAEFVQLVRAKKLRRKSTDAERLLWHYLKNRGLEGMKFRRQYRIGPVITDFFCPARKLVVELDGGLHHKNKETDEVRTKFIEGKGCRVIRFWNNEGMAKSNEVLGRITRELRKTGRNK